LDTNVLVSGLLQSLGPSGRIVAEVATGIHQVCYDDRVLDEYQKVLRRPKFGFDFQLVDAVVAQLKADGLPVTCTPLPERLPDVDDEKFLEVALAGSAGCLVTGNLRHFPTQKRCGVIVLSPREFVTLP
jgi:putative PIN family toxin of toxin-antitoxin system